MDNEKHVSVPMRRKLWTPVFSTGVGIIVVGAIVTIVRLVFGLGAITNLSDGFPWGIWIAFDVVVGIALAAGGFVTAAVVYVLNKGKYSPLVRPAVLTALLGYAMAAFGVFVDVGRWWQLYNPFLPENWQGSSALFEVCICVMTYLLVLTVEFTPILTDKWRKRPDGILKRISAKHNVHLLIETLLGQTISPFAY